VKQIEENVDKSFLDGMIPPLRELGNRKVTYVNKNLQYKFDDGMHMKSSLRRKIKDELLNSTGTIAQPQLMLQLPPPLKTPVTAILITIIIKLILLVNL
jgi:hypothetical protein